MTALCRRCGKRPTPPPRPDLVDADDYTVYEPVPGMVVLTFSDCDPAGWQMPISIARKRDAGSRIPPRDRGASAAGGGA